MDKQRQDSQIEPTYSSSMPIQDVALKTCQEQWTIEKGGKRGSGIFVLMAQHDDDMHKAESVLQNEIKKIFWDFEIQMDHLILARRPDLVLINKKRRICPIVDFAVLTNLTVKIKESEKIDKYLHFARELKKAVKHAGDGDTNFN